MKKLATVLLFCALFVSLATDTLARTTRDLLDLSAKRAWCSV